MTYWRMQLHPHDPGGAIGHSVASLAASYIGLDFSEDVNDLMTVAQSALPERQRDYWAFAHEMAVGDKVLIIAHHYPFALVTVDGEYNFIRKTVPDLGVWFRHFRRVRDVSYYADFVTDALSWERITMTDTISPLRDSNSKSYQLITRWMV